MKKMDDDVLVFIVGMSRHLPRPRFQVWVNNTEGDTLGNIDVQRTVLIMAAQLMIFAQK